ncbi:MAG TPA: hypothetical protein VH950_06150 [Gaiellaceae bacterium]|jgi:hypothetical protein
MPGDASGRLQARVPAVIEHRQETRSWLRRRRLQIALAVAALEGLLVLVGVLPWWSVLVLAAVGLAAYLAVGRDSSSADVRDVTWIAAVSQLSVVLLPLLAAVVSVLVVVVVVLLAGAALVALLLDRR